MSGKIWHYFCYKLYCYIGTIQKTRGLSDMTYISKNSFLKMIPFFLSLFLPIGCSTVNNIFHPSEESSSSPESTIQKEDYKGPKAKIVVTKFIDKSSNVKTSGQTEDRMAEMLGNSLLATNRFIVQMRLSVKDPKQLVKGTDLLIESTIAQFDPGKIENGKPLPSRVLFILNVTDTRTGQRLISQNVEGKAAPLENAIKKAIEASTRIIVTKTPSEYYRFSSVPSPPSPPPKESSKPPKTQPEVTSLPPVKSGPSLRVIQVAWSYVNLREGPGTSYKNVGSIKQGTSMALLEERGDWLRVRLSDRREGWVSRQGTTLAPDTAPPPSSTPAPPSPPTIPNPM